MLRDYQVEGFQWLCSLFQNGINGILADEMGLGKTIQCIALVTSLVEHNVPGPFLICAPLSTVPNWVSEFQTFAPKLPVILYHGSKEARHEMRSKIMKPTKVRKGLSLCPVVITSYEIAMNDSKMIAKNEWRLMIVDEGHRVKNAQCKLIHALKTYNCPHRLLLTGTPLQNNLAELWSLLNFLLPDIFCDLGSFEMWFDLDHLQKAGAVDDEIIAEETKHNVLAMLHQVLTPFMLRRLKKDVDLDVPPKREILVYAPLSEKQERMYKATLDSSILRLVGIEKEEKFDYDSKGRSVRKTRNQVDYSLMTDQDIDRDSDAKVDKWVKDILQKQHNDEESRKPKIGPKDTKLNIQLRSVMALLRKICNHPHLVEYPLTKSGEFLINQQLVKASGKMEMLDRMLVALKKDGHKVLIFSQMTSILDVLMDYCQFRKYSFCRLDGSTKLDDRREEIHRFSQPGGPFIFLLSTRAGGLGINLTAADTVIIFDSDWNPQSDLQAQDRCHRIGQTKPVLVFRFITANTIDQRIVERAAAKRKLEKLVIHREKFKKGSVHEKFSIEDLDLMSPVELKKLLEEADYDMRSRSEAISDEDLAKLLDRSELMVKWKLSKQEKGNPL
ncbi:hypothetical protein CAPTEDRAFT_180039 [Capitella teleta]|uniref:Proliferation-associated SNF2-like protein n=1 Tax=Capitella teleta TaxID=283909 RepID=R7TVL3_CAPTE|nr:hypothetical protein CAPTEDRAFT_180039 [Capitella teleta]|eukprot:ELT97754.1 hypothetical protein CAPTEDRAFT_180039 [Capitella teleta]